VAAKLGYRRNALASEVMRDFKRGRVARRRETIAYLCWAPRTEWNEPDNEFYSRIFRGVEERCAQIGTDAAVTWLKDPAVSLPRLGGILRARGVRGLILAPVPDVVHMPEFPWSEFAAVTIGNMLLTPRLHRLQTEHGENVALCLDHLESCGAQRIGYVGERQIDRRTGNLAISRYAYFQLGVPAERRIPPLVWDEWDDAALIAWLNDHRPDAIICQGHEHPLRILRQRRYRRIHFCLVTTQLNKPDIAGVLPRHELLGARAVDLVAGAIAHRDFGPPSEPMNVYVPGLWRDA
jgi:LacI family transcriptional regulator